MPRVHLYVPDWLHRRQRLERPNLNLSQTFNRALINELDGPDAVYMCPSCGQLAARALHVERPPNDQGEEAV